jgi:hypothetical protein
MVPTCNITRSCAASPVLQRGDKLVKWNGEKSNLREEFYGDISKNV